MSDYKEFEAKYEKFNNRYSEENLKLQKEIKNKEKNPNEGKEILEIENIFVNINIGLKKSCQIHS